LLTIGGLIVNPDGLTNQIEGNVIQGVSRTLLEEVQFDASGVKESRLGEATRSFGTQDVPDVQVVLIDRKEMQATRGRRTVDCTGSCRHWRMLCSMRLGYVYEKFLLPPQRVPERMERRSAHGTIGIKTSGALS